MPQNTLTIPSQAFSLASGNTLPTYKFVKAFVANDTTSLPLSNTKSGNLFNDRFNANLRWYLPKFELAADPDPVFGFAAGQSGVDNQGLPFNKGLLTMSVRKSVPDDVQTFKAANPGFQYQEISLLNLAATLITTFTDATTGKSGQNIYSGKIAVTPGGDLQLIFDNIIGPGLIILFDNLQKKGANISISYNYEVWTQTGFKKVIIMRPIWTGVQSQNGLLQTTVVTSHQFIHGPIIARRTLPPEGTGPVVLHEPPPSPTTITVGEDTFQRTSLDESLPLSLDNKYNANVYSLKFTISVNGAPERTIINENDLAGFNVKQSEFTELKVLGDIRQKYPSLSRLYQGILSKTIIVIPVTYSMVRSTHGLSAICQALLDSADGSDSKCKFDFTFTLAPDISSIEFLQLTQDIIKVQELKGYTVILPSFLKEGISPKLMSSFQSSTSASNTADQHLFALGVEIKDQANDSPAIAEANILLGQLCQDKDPYLMATLSLKLDDNFADPVETNAVLNFHKTTSTDELTYSVDDNLKIINFQNNSPYDLVIDGYAVCNDNSINIQSPNLSIKSKETVSAPYNPVPGNLSIVVDSDINMPGQISKESIEKFLAFQVQDVAQTKFTFGINAASVDFDTPGINQIDVQIKVRELPNISIPQFSLVKLRAVNSSFALIPIQNAISSLNADILLTVHYIDTSKADTGVNLQHQFIDQPIMILQNSDIIK